MDKETCDSGKKRSGLGSGIVNGKSVRRETSVNLEEATCLSLSLCRKRFYDKLTSFLEQCFSFRTVRCGNVSKK